MKIFINKSNFLRNLNLEENLVNYEEIVKAAKNYYSPYKTVVEIQGSLISINLSGVNDPAEINEILIATKSLGLVKLSQAVQVLEKLCQNDPGNKVYFSDLYKVYELKGDLDIVLEKLLNP